MSSPAPELKDVQSLAKTAIEAWSFFQDGGTGQHVDVISDTGLQEKNVAKKLRDKGAVVVVYPVLTWKLRDQSGGMVVIDATLLVKVKINPEVNADEAGADIYEVCSEVTKAMCRYNRHPGGEFFKIDSDSGALSQFDKGLWEYDLLFTKEVLI